MIMMGITVVFPVVAGALSHVIFSPLTARGRVLLDGIMPHRMIDITGDGTPDYKVPRHAVLYYLTKLFPSVVLSLLVQLISALVLSIIQKTSYFVAFYHCIVTATTVGYGDVDLSSNAAKIFAVHHILIAVTLLGELLTTVGLVMEERAAGLTRDRLVKAKLTDARFRRLIGHAEYLREQNHAESDAPRRGSQSLDQMEFLLAMIMEAGKIDTHDLQVFIRYFRRMDADQSGEIGIEDLHLMKTFDDKALRLTEARNRSRSHHVSVERGSLDSASTGI